MGMVSVRKGDVDNYLNILALNINDKRLDSLTITDVLQTLECKDFSLYTFTYVHFVVSLLVRWKRYCMGNSDIKTHLAFSINFPYIEDYIYNYDGENLNPNRILKQMDCTEEESIRLTQLLEGNKIGNLYDIHNEQFGDLDDKVFSEYGKEYKLLRRWEEFQEEVKFLRLDLKRWM